MFCKNLDQLSNDYDVFLIDVYGVLYDGNVFYDGVLDYLAEMKKIGKKLIILSNTTMVADDCKIKYRPKGLSEKHYDIFISSGEAFRRIIKDHIGSAKTYFSAFSPNNALFNKDQFKQTDTIREADFVYVGYLNSNRFYIADAFKDRNGQLIPMEDLTSIDCHDIADFDEITQILDLSLKFNKPLVIANPDIFALEMVSTSEFSEKRPVLCQGAIGEFYERMGGKVIYFGKPYQAIYDFAKQFIPNGSKTAMIGDTLWTDILGGNMAGVDTILVLTGVSGTFMKSFVDGDINSKVERLLSKISSKMTHKSLKEFSQIPTHIIERFA